MPKVLLNKKSIRRAAPATGQVELRDSITPGFGLRIAAGGARTYFVMRRVKGKMVRRTVGKAPPPSVEPDDKLPPGELWPDDARQQARVMLAELERGVDPRAVAEAKERHAAETAAEAARNTFASVAASYFADPSKRGGAKLRSRAELERKVKVDCAEWAEKPVASITKADVKELLRGKAATSPVAANRLLALVRRILRWAAREDLISANPAWEIDPPGDETERDRVLTMEEIARVWRAADALGYPFGPIVQLLILTAQRRGEVGELRWPEIDGDVWRLPDARAKRGKGHVIPLSPRAVRILAKQKRVEGTDLVFTTTRRRTTLPDGKKAPPAAVGGWSRARERLEKLIAEAVAKDAKEELDMERHALAPFTLHDIRRSVATHLRDAGVMGDDRVDRLTVSKILNHAEGGMTRLYDRYAEEPEQRRALAAWTLRIEALVGLNVIDLEGARA
ncbi:MAG: tyrosine-type recombinase/integrase [Caulobacterales bacterium]